MTAHPSVAHAVALTTGTGAHRHLITAVVPAFEGTGITEDVVPAIGTTSNATGELEAGLVETLLVTRVLAGADLAGARSITDVVSTIDVVEDQVPLVRLWLSWLTERDVLDFDGTRWTPGVRFPVVSAPGRLAELRDAATVTSVADLAERLPARAEALCSLVTGGLSAAALLEDPLLSPEALADRSDEGVTVLAARVAELATSLGRAVRLAEIDGRTGRTAERLLNLLTPEQVEYVLVDSSVTLLAQARERCADHPQLTDLVHWADRAVPTELLERFDMVLADNALHRDADVEHAVRAAVLLVRPGGVLLARERLDLGPLAMVTAAALERGFADLDPARRARGGPLLTVAEWTGLFLSAGLSDVDGQAAGPDTVVLWGVRRTPPVPDANALRDWAAERLPGYMVPERVILFPTLPLTVNGKIDRNVVAAAVGDGDADTVVYVSPAGAMEQILAALWRELLGAPSVGREHDFFALGGDSLLATRMVTRLRAMGVVGAELRRLFDTPTLAGYAAGLSTADEPPVPVGVLAVDPEHRFDPFPMTDVQQAYLLGRKGDFALGGVGTHYYSEFQHAEIDLDRLEEAWNRLIARHDMLRAVFAEDGTQRVLAEVPRFRISRLEAAPGSEAAALEAMRAAMSHQVIDPATWPLVDVRAVCTEEGTRIGISLDNIVLDGLSMMIVFAELEKLYADPEVELPPVGVSFRDYVLTVRASDEERDAARAYWRARLADLPPGPLLPLAQDPARLRSPRFTRRSTRLDARSWQRIKDRARERGITPSAVLLSCYGEVLSAWGSRRDLTINLTLFDRAEAHPDINNVLGDFTSLLLVAYQPEPGEGFLRSARRAQEQTWRDLDHHQVSAVWVLRELTKVTGGAQAGMPVVFTSALGVGDELAGFGTERFADRVWGISQTPQVWLDQQVYESRGELVVDWDAVEELFPPGVLDAMFAAHTTLLHWLATEDWDAPVPDLVPSAQRAVRQRVNAGRRPATEDLLHTGFLDWSSRAPEATALVWDDREITYSALREHATRIAGALVSAGVDAGDPVGVTIPKGPDQIAAVLGVLLLGGVYVPVGVDQPTARRDRVLRTAGVRVLLAGPGVTGPREMLTLPVDTCRDAESITRLPAVSPDEPAYVIFTSGSTGEPKGVEVSHRAAVNTLAEVSERFSVTADDRVLAVSALDFDLSVYDILGVLAVGGALVLISEDERREPRRWLELIARHQVSVWNSVPALLDMLLTTAEGSGATTDAASLRLALLSGDWVALDLPERLARRWPDCRLVVMGGATEAAVWSNAIEVTGVPPRWTSIPYGFPLRGQRYRVVDERGRDCPDWVTGELWIGGAGIALGYRGAPELTAARFVEHDGERWYRTGDVGRYWSDGMLEFLGRLDHQVKIRGHRIELGEVEAALDAHPSVRRCVVIAVGERTKRRLVACLVADPPPDRRELTAFLADRLAPGAVPGTFLLLDALPLTGNGKVDRAALTRLAESEQPEPDEHEAPVGPLETEFAEVWAALLGLPSIGRHQNFFVLGADSLLATRFVEVIRLRRGLELSLAQVFEALTVAALAALVADQIDHTTDDLMEDGVV